MLLFKLFACITGLIIPTWAAIPITDLKVSVFDSSPRDFELGVMHILNTTREFYANHNVSSLLDIAVQFVPYVGEISKTVKQLRETMVENSQWRTQFTKAITDQTLREIAESEIHRMKSTMQTVESKIKILNESNPDLSNRKTIASILHTELDKLINFFDLKTSLLRKYPLLGAPPLIQLASLIAIFAPFAKSLIPLEAMHPQLSCKMRDVLIDYRPRTVNARLHHIYTDTSIFETMIEVMSMPYNAEHDYNQTDSDVIDCQRGCTASKEIKMDEFCLKDEFSADEFQVNNLNEATCVKDYASMIRRRVDELFPIDLLNKSCDDVEPKIATGFGWFTINMQTVFTFGEMDGSSCKFYARFGCDSFIKLLVNGQQQLKSSTVKDKYIYDAEITFTTQRIPKNSTIVIEIWDESSAFWESDELILQTKGDVQSFLSEPLHTGAVIDGRQNAIETISFWQDEYTDVV